MGGVITYTAIFGDYDKLYEPYFMSAGAQLVCFTDNEGLAGRRWNVRVVKRQFDDPTRDARWYKVLSHRVFPDAETTIWVDANLELWRAMCSEVTHILDGKDIAVYHHDRRECAYDEMRECHKLGKDDARVMAYQMARYRREKFPERFGLAQTSFLVRKNTPLTRLFNEAWWREMERGSRRDQLSFDYCRWQLGVSVHWILGTVWDGQLFMTRLHK